MRREVTGYNKIRSKRVLAVALLVINSLTWLYMMRKILQNNLNHIYPADSLQLNLIFWGIFNFAIIGSSIIATLLSNRVRRPVIFYIWIPLGIFASILIYYLPNLGFFHILIIFCLSGISFGLGMPECLAYFAEETDFLTRGTIGGLIFFLTNLLTPLILAFSTNFILAVISIVIWRALVFLLFPLIFPKESVFKKRKEVPYKLVIFDRRFLLYFIPWLMFSLIYSFQRVVIERNLSADFVNLLTIIAAISGTISAFFAGILCGQFGRKRIIILGFVSLGIAYGIIGVSPSNWLFPFYLYGIVGGAAWGILLLMFVLVLWGDLSETSMNSPQKYYALGSLPFFLSDSLGFLFSLYILIPVNEAFSVASFFLFLAVVPLMYAPETLPEKVIREKELKKYIEKAKKIREKYEKEKD
ncbi:MAG: hypothetical protein ACTSXW_04045 [Candidatus Baldrarchaeia archaeon]